MANADQAKTSGGLARLAKRSLSAPFVILAAVVILIEDWLWEDLARMAAAIGRLPILRSIEAFVAGLPPYPALLFFATPALLLVPLKLIALFLISHGQATMGVLTIIFAKFAGTALVAPFFPFTPPLLWRMVFFSCFYVSFPASKPRIYPTIKTTAIYQLFNERHRKRRVLRPENPT